MISYASLNKTGILVLLVAILLLTGCAATSTQFDSSSIKKEVKEKEYPADDVLHHVITASIYESQGDFLHALTEYNQALLYDSTDAEIYLAISEMYQRIGQYDSALKVLQRGSGASILKDEILRVKGELEFQAQDLEAAAGTFKQLVEIHPDDAETWSNLAFIYERLGKPLEAVECYESLKVLNPGEKESILGRQGTLLTTAGKYEEAISRYQELYKLRPNAHILPFLIGGLHLDIGDTSKAADYFTIATDAAPYEPRYWDLKIRLEIIRGNKDKALSQTHKALQINEASPDILSLAGSVFMNYDMLDEAEHVLIQAVELDSANVLNLLNLGFLYHELEEWEKAERVYVKARTEAPAEIQVLNNYAYMLAEAGYNLDLALEMVDTALGEAPDNASYLDTKGWIHFKLNQFEESEVYLLKAHEIDSENYEILLHLGELYYMMGQQEKADNFWKKALEKGADESSIRSRGLEESIE
jgi:Flp pilus assembly protein TadD